MFLARINGNQRFPLSFPFDMFIPLNPPAFCLLYQTLPWQETQEAQQEITRQQRQRTGPQQPSHHGGGRADGEQPQEEEHSSQVLH